MNNKKQKMNACSICTVFHCVTPQQLSFKTVCFGKSHSFETMLVGHQKATLSFSTVEINAGCFAAAFFTSFASVLFLLQVVLAREQSFHGFLFTMKSHRKLQVSLNTIAKKQSIAECDSQTRNSTNESLQ